MTTALCAFAWLAADLWVVHADRDRVELRWNTVDPAEDAIVLRRSLDGEFRRIGAGRGGFIDRDFDPLARYLYRVDREELGRTNEVAVGAPPVALVEVWPDAKPAELRLALDAAGDPHFAWLERQGDSASLWYGRWHRSGAQWSKPRHLADVGQVEKAPRYPLSIAIDRDTGRVGIVYEVNRDGTRLMLAIAPAGKDQFETREILNGGGRWFADVRLALARGEAFLAYQQQDSGAHFTRGPLARDPRFWLTEAAPLAGGYRDPGGALDLALDGDGRPVLAYALSNADGSAIVHWRPPENPVVVRRSPNAPRTSLRLAFNGLRPHLLADADFLSERGADLTLTSADPRQEWTPPAPVSPGVHATLNAPFSLDVSGRGEVVIAAEAPDGFIHVGRSPDGVKWPARDLRKFEGRCPEIGLASNGALLLAFADAEAKGIWFWREE